MCVQYCTPNVMLYHKKSVFKASGKLLLNLLSYFFNTKNLCSVFKTSRKLLFSLLNYFCNMKNVCSKQMERLLLVYSATFAIRKKRGCALRLEEIFWLVETFL